jgi:hypothetical protein
MKRVGPFQIVERKNQFEVRQGRSVLSRHSSFLAAEDYALRHWLAPKRKHDDEDFAENELRPNFDQGSVGGH